MVHDATQRELSSSLMIDGADHDTETDDQISIDGAVSSRKDPALRNLNKIFQIPVIFPIFQPTFEMIEAPQKKSPAGVLKAA